MNYGQEKAKPVEAALLTVFGVVFLLAAVFLGLFIGSSRGIKQDEAQYIYDVTESDVYAFVNAQYISDGYGYYDEDEDKWFYLAFDEEGWPNIIYVDDADFTEEYENLMDYLYSDTPEEDAPPMQYICGMSREIDSELRELTIDYYNELLDEDTHMTVSDFRDTFGVCYLEVGSNPETPFYLWILLGISAALGLAFLLAGIGQIKTNKRLSKMTNPSSAAEYMNAGGYQGGYGSPQPYQGGYGAPQPYQGGYGTPQSYQTDPNQPRGQENPYQTPEGYPKDFFSKK